MCGRVRFLLQNLKFFVSTQKKDNKKIPYLLMNNMNTTTNDRGGGFGSHNTTSNAGLGGALLSECTIRVENRFEIRVDTWGKKNAFSTNNNDNILHQIPTFYFLTHMHQDHLRGLREDTFENESYARIYGTEITKILLVKRFPRLESKVKVLEFDSVEVVEVVSNEKNTKEEDLRFNVYCLDAGHCPGSAMFVLEGTFGKVLHTGDSVSYTHLTLPTKA